MHTIRRIYFYSITLISLEIVIWGLIGILRSAFSYEITPPTYRLAQALALLTVGLPVFLLHWVWIQHQVSKNEEEQTASLRSLFLYGVLLATLIPVTQNLLAFVNRTLFDLANVRLYPSLAGSSQHWTDNWIAILFNGIAAFYFITVLSRDWKATTDRGRHADSRRLYLYTWIIYASFWIIHGLQQIIRFLLYLSTDSVERFGYSLPLNGFALLMVCAPIWFYAWNAIQKSLSREAERESMLRSAVLVVLSLIGAAVTLSTLGVTISIVIRIIFGEQMEWVQFINRVKNPVSLGIPVAIAWAYYGYWLKRQVHAFSEAARGFRLKRVYTYILAFAGLAVAVLGLALLLDLIIDVGVGYSHWSQLNISRLADILAILIVGLPLWLAAWLPMIPETLTAGEKGRLARRSNARRTYLYAAIFGSVIGGMASAIWMAYLLISTALGSTLYEFAANLLKAASFLGLSAGVLIDHLLVLRKDNLSTADQLAEQHRQFRVTLFDTGETTFVQAMTAAIHRQAPDLPLTIQPVGTLVLEEGVHDVQAAILPLDLALNQPETLREWLRSFRGRKLIVPVKSTGWQWSGHPASTLAVEAQQAALALRHLAEGQDIRSATPFPDWTIALWVFAVLGVLSLTAIAILMLFPMMS